MNYKAVVFDFDYTLGDATEAIMAGFVHALTAMGWPAPQREDVRRTVGLPVQDGYTMLTGDTDPGRRQEFYGLFHPVARDAQARGNVELFPGAEELLRALKAKGIPTAVVSTKPSVSLGHVFRHLNIRDCFDYVVGGDMVAASKPDPEGVRWVMEQLGLEPDQVLYCGDTVIDAATAQNAGTHFCAVLNGTTPAEDFAPYPTDHIAPDLVELKNWLGL